VANFAARESLTVASLDMAEPFLPGNDW
jgi:hypothetical protein